ncbi:MAG: hypothetical protein ACOC0A_00885 [Planctomycetota bacterium]
MPSDKRDTDNSANDTVYGSGSGDAEQKMAKRLMAFGLAIVVLGVVAVWFVATTFGRQPNQAEVRLSADVEHTVRVLSGPPESKNKIQSMLQSSTLRDLIGGHDVYMTRVEGGRIALCAGRFDSENSAEARELLRKIKQYERKGEKPFQSAELMKISVGQ